MPFFSPKPTTPVNRKHTKRPITSPTEPSEIKKQKGATFKTPPGATEKAKGLSMDKGEIKKIIEGAVKGLRGDIKLLRDDITSLKEDNKTLNKRVETLLDTVEEKTKLIDTLKEENGHLKERLNQLETNYDRQEQYSRRNSLRVAGISEENPENKTTDELIIDLAAEADITLTINDIDRSHRVGKRKPDKPRDILVKFTSYQKRRLMFSNKKAINTKKGGEVFIGEDLTRFRQELCFKGRNHVRQNKINKLWTADGSIFVRKDKEEDNFVIKKIENLGDLETFIHEQNPE